MTTTSTLTPVRRIELILQQIESLPTLSAVAVRLLELTTSENSKASDVIEVVSCDASLSSKVLRLCQTDPTGRALHVTELDRAVKLLGFEAVRSAALSVQFFELLDGLPSVGGETRGDQRHVFDRKMFWQHSLAVGVAAERMTVALSRDRHQPTPATAFLAGLLHDIGHLALHVTLPATFDKVCEMAETHAVSIDQACQRLIGLDTHTAGKRLAEHWRLPHLLADVMWLTGQPYGSLPELPHKKLIGVVSLADAVARRQHLSSAGHAPRNENLTQLAAELGLPESIIFDLVPRLHEEVNRRADAIGIHVARPNELLLQSIGRANQILGRINAALQQKTAVAARHGAALRAIARFHRSIVPGLSVTAVLGRIVMSAADVFGDGFFSMLYQASQTDPWQLLEFAPDGRLIGTQVVGPAADFPNPDALAEGSQLSMEALSILPMLRDHLPGGDVSRIRLLPLRCGWGVSAVLVHDSPETSRLENDQIEAMGRTWGSAIASAAQHSGAKRLGEQLADANRALSEARDELARKQLLASLGEIAAGAAHEMNNPLTVISGRSQLLATQLTDLEMRGMAAQIVEQAEKLSGMISALRLFTEPVAPDPRPVDLRVLLADLVEEFRPKTPSTVEIRLAAPEIIPPMDFDSEQIASAVRELLRNAVEARPASFIEVRIQTDPSDGRWMIQIVDDGPGLSDYVTAHAFDPFFSAKPAGRQPGLGLPRARQLVEANGGQLTLRNHPVGGALATIWLGQPLEQETALRGAA